MTTRQPIVAIDGPAGSGKSTVAQTVARRAELQFISSGSLYRSVAVLALRESVPVTDRTRLITLAAGLQLNFRTEPDGAIRVFMDGKEITEALRQPGVDQMASIIATITELRAQIVAKLREIGQTGGIIMEGRDIQTVVFPQADIKIFLTASPEERARRRWKELTAKGETISYQDILTEVLARDSRDIEREASPLRAAPDAIGIDTDTMTIDQVIDCLLHIIDTWRNTPGLHGAALAHAAGCGEGVS